MSPTLLDGDYIITKKPRQYTPGLIYVINHIDLGRIVKRLNTVKDSYLTFTGDNPSSTPDTLIGRVTPDRVIGQALWVISDKGLRRA